MKKRSEEIPKTLCQPEDEINQQLLRCVHKCKKSEHFWQNFKLEQFNSQITPATNGEYEFEFANVLRYFLEFVLDMVFI